MTQPLNFPIYLPEDRDEIPGRSLLPLLFWSLLAVTTLFRFFYALKLPLTGDEAYFWEWARHPALGYYDHPPMAGWILWLTRSLLGDTVAAVRLPAVLAGTLVVIIVNRFTFHITGSFRAASLTGILTMGLPLIGVFGVLYSTDTPLLAAGTLGGYLFFRALESDSPVAWGVTGACFAVLLSSKFLGAPLIAACALYLAVFSEARKHLRTPGPYIAMVITLLGLIPVIVWNATHAWSTFAFNFASRHEPPAFGILHVADYAVGQALALSPVVLILGVPLLARFLLFSRGLNRSPWELPAFLAAIPLGGFFLLSFVTKIGLHWPGVGVPFLAVALGAHLWESGRGKGRYYLCIGTAWAVTALIFILPLIPALLPPHWQYPLRPDKINSAQVRKYTASTGQIGALVTTALETLPEGTKQFIFSRSYALSSLVAFYTPGNPEVTVLGGGSAHGRNHTYWFDPSLHIGHNAVFVTYNSAAGERAFLEARFHHWETLTDSADPDGTLVSVIMCYGYNGEK